MQGGKKHADDGYLSHYLDVICPRYTAFYDEQMGINRAAGKSQSPTHVENMDALDVLALLLMKELGIESSDLCAARAYLSILIENEHLATPAQLSEKELLMLRDLLFSYFKGAEDMNEKGAQVLALIETKFAAGEFSQAKILLQIFETNIETRQNNERNLYYEEMIRRLDVVSQKGKRLSAAQSGAGSAPDADDDTVLKLFSVLEENDGVRFYLNLRSPEEMHRWETSLAVLPAETRDYIMDYIPVIRWRQLGSLPGPLLRQIGDHMTFEMLRRHVQQKLKMCYFLLLASGCTGYEWFIFSFSKWSQDIFHVDVREVFPMLHRSGIVDGMCLQEVLDVTTDRFYGRAMNEVSINTDTLEKAYRDTLKFIFTTDFSQVPAGYYNFGSFVLDNILPFTYENPVFAYRLHSMM